MRSLLSVPPCTVYVTLAVPPSHWDRIIPTPPLGWTETVRCALLTGLVDALELALLGLPVTVAGDISCDGDGDVSLAWTDDEGTDQQAADLITAVHQVAVDRLPTIERAAKRMADRVHGLHG